jgi:hypothetical protein
MKSRSAGGMVSPAYYSAKESPLFMPPEAGCVCQSSESWDNTYAGTYGEARRLQTPREWALSLKQVQSPNTGAVLAPRPVCGRSNLLEQTRNGFNVRFHPSSDRGIIVMLEPRDFAVSMVLDKRAETKLPHHRIITLAHDKPNNKWVPELHDLCVRIRHIDMSITIKGSSVDICYFLPNQLFLTMCMQAAATYRYPGLYMLPSTLAPCHANKSHASVAKKIRDEQLAYYVVERDIRNP